LIIEASLRDMTEAALAHTVDSKTEEAYRRTDMIEKRRRMMELWSRHCASTPIGDNVVPFARVIIGARQDRLLKAQTAPPTIPPIPRRSRSRKPQRAPTSAALSGALFHRSDDRTSR
jgi:hypothetical protein